MTHISPGLGHAPKSPKKVSITAKIKAAILGRIEAAPDIKSGAEFRDLRAGEKTAIKEKQAFFTICATAGLSPERLEKWRELGITPRGTWEPERADYWQSINPQEHAAILRIVGLARAGMTLTAAITLAQRRPGTAEKIIKTFCPLGLSEVRNMKSQPGAVKL